MTDVTVTFTGIVIPYGEHIEFI